MILNMAMPLVEKNLHRVPEGLKSLAAEYGVSEVYLMVRNKTVPSDKDPNILIEKAFFSIMGIVDGKFSILKNKDGADAEYGIDKNGIDFIMSKMSSSDDE